MTESPVEVGAAAIVRIGEDGRWRVLAARRTYRRGDVDVSGLWEFPGGKREASESMDACIVREIAEELGVAVRLHQRVAGPAQIDTGSRLIAFDLRFATIVGDDEPALLDGHDALAWLTPEEFDDIAWIPSDVEHVAEVRRLLLDPASLAKVLR